MMRTIRAAKRISQFMNDSLRNYASGKNFCSVLQSAKQLSFEERAIPKPNDNQVLIKVDTVGICGSDVHFFKHFAIGPFSIQEPLVLGHEGGGVIIEMGKNVKGLKVGDRVAVEPVVPCGKCYPCRIGKYILCRNLSIKGLPPEHGLFQQYVVHNADYCYKLPDNMTMDDASLLEPLSVAIHGARRSGVKVGNTILVLGAGPIGLMSLLTAKAFGATNIAITDIADNRLAIAKEIGADLTINVKDKSTEDVIKIITDQYGDLADVTMECAGYQPCIELAIRGTKAGGHVVFLALAMERCEIPIMDVVCREIVMLGSLVYTDTWPLGIKLVSTGKIQFNKLTRTHFELKDIKEGFAKSMRGEVVKVFVKCNP